MEAGFAGDFDGSRASRKRREGDENRLVTKFVSPDLTKNDNPL
jgi:hypothetical protein